jgi:magnesium-transporting ATPase (P-type)
VGRKYAYVNAFCECDLPNKELYEFNGKILIPKDASTENYDEGDQYPLSENQLLLKGAKLRNTDWVIAFVVYTGNDTRLMQNQ